MDYTAFWRPTEVSRLNSPRSKDCQVIKLILPVLFPSWRFFSRIGPSPRLEYGFGNQPSRWHEFRPRPQGVHWLTGLRRLFHNPQWNEYLFVTCCAERLLEEPTQLLVDEIFARLLWAIAKGEIAVPKGDDRLSFRVLIVERSATGLTHSPAYIASPIDIGVESAAC